MMLKSNKASMVRFTGVPKEPKDPEGSNASPMPMGTVRVPSKDRMLPRVCRVVGLLLMIHIVAGDVSKNKISQSSMAHYGNKEDKIGSGRFYNTRAHTGTDLRHGFSLTTYTDVDMYLLNGTKPEGENSGGDRGYKLLFKAKNTNYKPKTGDRFQKKGDHHELEIPLYTQDTIKDCDGHEEEVQRLCNGGKGQLMELSQRSHSQTHQNYIIFCDNREVRKNLKNAVEHSKFYYRGSQWEEKVFTISKKEKVTKWQNRLDGIQEDDWTPVRPLDLQPGVNNWSNEHALWCPAEFRREFNILFEDSEEEYSEEEEDEYSEDEDVDEEGSDEVSEQDSNDWYLGKHAGNAWNYLTSWGEDEEEDSGRRRLGESERDLPIDRLAKMIQKN